MIITPTRDRDEDILCLENLPYWIDLYLQDCRLELASPATLTHYRNALKRFGIWYATRTENGLLDRRTARDFAYWLSREKHRYDDHPGRPTEGESLSPATVRRTVGVVRTFLTWLYNEFFVPRDFANWFPFPKVEETPLRIVSPDTIQAMLCGAAEGDMPIRDVALIALLADTGMRRTEVVRLRVDQLRWNGDDGRGWLQDVAGKGEYLRNVPFSALVGAQLQQWLERRETLIDSAKTVSYLFISRYREAMKPASVYQVLKRAASRGGVADEVWNTHGFRHCFATHHWREQRDSKALAMLLGHKSPKTTESYYVHPVPDDLMKAHTSLLVTGQVQPPQIASVRPAPPSRIELQEAIQHTPNWIALGREFGLSDVGVRKMAERQGLLETYYQARSAV